MRQYPGKEPGTSGTAHTGRDSRSPGGPPKPPCFNANDGVRAGVKVRFATKNIRCDGVAFDFTSPSFQKHLSNIAQKFFLTCCSVKFSAGQNPMELLFDGYWVCYAVTAHCGIPAGYGCGIIPVDEYLAKNKYLQMVNKTSLGLS